MKRAIFSLIVLLWMGSSHAYTECTTTILRFYVGDDGLLWLIFDGGLAAYVTGESPPHPTADPDFKSLLTVATAALLAEKTVTVRFAADGVPCTNGPAVRSDVQGMWIWK